MFSGLLYFLVNCTALALSGPFSSLPFHPVPLIMSYEILFTPEYFRILSCTCGLNSGQSRQNVMVENGYYATVQLRAKAGV